MGLLFSVGFFAALGSATLTDSSIAPARFDKGQYTYGN